MGKKNKRKQQQSTTKKHDHDHSEQPQYIPNSSQLTLSKDRERTESEKHKNEFLEAVNYYTIIQAFANYEIHAFHQLMIRQHNFNLLSEERKRLIGPLVAERFHLQRRAISANYDLILKMLPTDHCGAITIGKPKNLAATTQTTTTVPAQTTKSSSGAQELNLAQKSSVARQEAQQEKQQEQEKQEQKEQKEHVVDVESSTSSSPSSSAASSTSADWSSCYPRRITIKTPAHIQPYVKVSDVEIDKVHSTIKTMMKDWTVEGSSEREAIYQPILQALISHFDSSDDGDDANDNKKVLPRSQVRILTPGCGLARLTWEIAQLGFSCQGNEYSFYMLLAANFILNQVDQVNQFDMYPFVHQHVNLMTASDQVRPVSIPDINPASINRTVKSDDVDNENVENDEKAAVIAVTNPPADFSMVAGDFVEVYSDENYRESFDCVVTCFFIDTAKNVFDYIDVIWKILKKGGVWINLGPLLYHFAEMPGVFSVELTYEELKRVILDRERFAIVDEKRVESGYCNNPKSMLQSIYNSVFFKAIKQ